MAAAGRVDPAAADALRERRPLPPDLVPGPRRPLGAPARQPLAARAERLRPLPPDGRGVPRARRGAARADGLGRARSSSAGSSASGRSTAASSSTASGVFRHVLVALRPSGADRCRRSSAGDPRAVHAYEPHEYAGRRGRGRRRDGGGDGVAERARRGRAGDLGAPPGAGAAAAQRAASALLAPRARRFHASAPAERAGDPRARCSPPRTRRAALGRAARAGRRALPRRGRR